MSKNRFDFETQRVEHENASIAYTTPKLTRLTYARLPPINAKTTDAPPLDYEMTFHNEFIPSIENETSSFLRVAREKLNTGHTKYDQWSVDRDRNMALFRRGGGHSVESSNLDFWSFLTEEREYCIDTELISTTNISQKEIAMTRRISFRGESIDYRPSEAILSRFKEALSEYGRWHLFDPCAFDCCQLTLIDAITGAEV